MAQTSTGRRPILSATMLNTSAPISTPKLPADNSGPSVGCGTFHSANIAVATKPIAWTSKPSMISEARHSANTRTCREPMRQLSSSSVRLIAPPAAPVVCIVEFPRE